MSDAVGQIALELGIDSSQIVNQLTGASNKAAKQATTIFSGLGKKIAAGLSIAAVTKLTKDCIEVGSNVTEVQNVVDTAFKDLSWQADQWASNAMTNFGLSELSAKKYMGVFGQMSNAMGITGKAALDMAENVTGLTGDVASFYNLGTDEAYTKLKSIWTGETETLKDLGVIMTQTNLDQYALNNGFDKTTAKMTEQEKVMLRYQYVTSALSNATGDFVKTQDSWANQTRILTLRFQQLKASLGKGFIALFTPILRGFNSLLAGLQKVADGFASFVQMLTGADISSSMGSISADIAGIGDDAGGAADNVSGIGDAAKKTAKDIEKSLAGFDQINKLTEPTDDSSSSGSGTDSTSGITAKGIYASHSWLNDYMNVDELIEHGALIWEAHWNDDGEICEDKFAMSQESSDYYLNDGTRVDYDIMYDEVYDRLTKANEYDHRNDGVEDNDNADEDNNAGADDTEQLQHEIGEYVEYNAIYAASTSEAALTPSAGFNSGRITRVIPWASNPYLIDDGTGWVNDGCIVSAGDSSDGESNEESETDISDIKAGDKVRVLLNVDYDTDRAFNLYYDEYDVIQVDGDRAVIGIDNTVTSAIDVHHLERI